MPSLPKWMQQAVKDQVLSPQEAQEWHQVALSASAEWIDLPEHLHEAASRVYLWERPAVNSLPA